MKQMFYLLCILFLGTSYSLQAQTNSSYWGPTDKYTMKQSKIPIGENDAILNRALDGIEKSSNSNEFIDSEHNVKEAYNDVPIFRFNDPIPVAYGRPVIQNNGHLPSTVIGVEVFSNPVLDMNIKSYETESYKVKPYKYKR